MCVESCEKKTSVVPLKLIGFLMVYPKPLQWGSEIRPSGLFEGQISNCPVFKWLGLSYGYSFSPNHLKTGPFEIRTFMSEFQMVFELCHQFEKQFNIQIQTILTLNVLFFYLGKQAMDSGCNLM